LNPSIIDDLACPACAGRLGLASGEPDAAGEVARGGLACRECGAAYPIEGYVARFVPRENYADSFGLQWNRHARTQVDKFNGTTISADRFWRETRWRPEELEGLRVLEVGCGAGRFTEVALAAGARCYSLDYSSAVDACRQNHGPHERLNLFQADVFRLPFRHGLFDRIFCFGVLQHTPNPAAAFAAMAPHLAPGGEIVVDAYAWPIAYLHPRHLLRPFTRRMERERLYRAVERWTPRLLPVSRALKRTPALGEYLARLVPVANYEGLLPLSEEQIREWAVLDTFDWLSPEYEKPQRADAVRGWFAAAGLAEVSVERIRGLFVGRGRKG